MNTRSKIESIYKNYFRWCGDCFCPARKLKDYIDQHGIDEVCRMYEKNELPEDVRSILEKRLRNMTS